MEEVMTDRAGLCGNCSIHMRVMSDLNQPIKLDCGHEVCLKCVLTGMP